MTVASLHPAPTCSACRALPALYLLEVDPARTGAADDSPVRRLPASARRRAAAAERRNARRRKSPPTTTTNTTT